MRRNVDVLMENFVIDADHAPFRPRKVLRANQVFPRVAKLSATDRTMLFCIDSAFHAHSPGRYKGRLTTAG